MAKMFDFDKVNIIVNGRYLTDFFEGSTVNIARAADSQIKHTGTKGEIAFAKNNDKSGSLTFSLQHTSSSKDMLDRYARSGEFISVAVIDSNNDGSMNIQNNQCMITKQADITRGLEIAAREWTIDIPVINM